MTKKKNNLPKLIKKAKTGKVTTCNCNKAALAKAIAVREQQEKPKAESKYFVDTVWASRFEMQSDGVINRHVVSATVYTDDPTQSEASKQAAINKARIDLEKDGFYAFDEEAIARGYELIEEAFDRVRHDLVYGRACPKCVAGIIENLVKSMHCIGELVHDRYKIAREVDDLPWTLPVNYWKDYDIVDRKFVKKTPELKEIHRITGDLKQITPEMLKQLPEPIQNLLKNAPAFIAGPATLKALPAPEPKKIAVKAPIALPNKKHK